jgi:peptide deformylase
MIKLVNKVLYRPAKPVTDFSEALRIGQQMLAYIKHPKTKALGLAAPQIGISKRFFVMNVNDFGMIIINPTIIDNASEPITAPEGCLSFPNKIVEVSRPSNIVVSFYNDICIPLEGLAARCFLHEYDHLDGITMFDRTRGSNA